MARGKGRKRPAPPGKRKDGHGPVKKQKFKSTNGRDIRHRDQFKRLPPVPKDLEVKQAGAEQESESEEEEDSYQVLLSSFSQKNPLSKVAVESEDESGEEADDNNELSGSGDELNLSSDDDAEDEEVNDGIDTDVSEEGDEGEDKTANTEDESESDVDEDSVGKALAESNGNGDGAASNQPSVGTDPFVKHIHPDLSDEAVTLLSDSKVISKHHELSWPKLGHIAVTIPDIPHEPSGPSTLKLLDELKEYAKCGTIPHRINSAKLEQYHLKSQMFSKIANANEKFSTNAVNGLLTPLQAELFSLFNNYQDVYFPERSLTNGEETRFTYCLHIANHVLKTRSACIHHNARLSKKEKDLVPDEFRDQGLVRPKALVIVPFRESGRRVIEMLIALLAPNEGKAGAVMNKNRFDDEFTGGELIMPKKNARPEDYEALFAGNTDDTFRVGITVTKKCVKLYADFYSSDILIASPLGLRTIIGAEGEADRDYDFLASIEILVMDQMDVCFMQNWEHVLHIMDHMHLQPRESHGTDFARVRSWAANGLARFYRQTLLFSSHPLPQFSALLTKRCHNYEGAARIINPVPRGTICKVVVQLPQLFQRIDVSSISESIDARFSYFTKKVLPQYSDTIMTHTLVYVPSYFDYVRIRNYFKRQDISFVQICEYSKDHKIARARDMFYHSQVHYILYSERFHFFRRPKIKGIRHIIFYQPPNQPHFYSEMCNLMHAVNQNPHAGSDSNMTVTVLYTKFDISQLASLVGSERATKMIASDQNVHMFMTGD